jgi:hypothetical protein
MRNLLRISFKWRTNETHQHQCYFISQVKWSSYNLHHITMKEKSVSIHFLYCFVATYALQNIHHHTLKKWNETFLINLHKKIVREFFFYYGQHTSLKLFATSYILLILFKCSTLICWRVSVIEAGKGYKQCNLIRMQCKKLSYVMYGD